MIRKLRNLYYKYIAPPEKYARYIGVNIGGKCLIATRYWSSEPYLITIGNNVQVTQDVKFYTHGGSHVAREKYPNFDVFGKIVIEDNAYLGSNSMIMPGVTVGKGALVAAGSVVTKSVPPYVVVGGNPARVICSVDEYIEHNLKYNINTKGVSSAQKKEILSDLPIEKFIRK